MLWSVLDEVPAAWSPNPPPFGGSLGQFGLRPTTPRCPRALGARFQDLGFNPLLAPGVNQIISQLLQKQCHLSPFAITAD